MDAGTLGGSEVGRAEQKDSHSEQQGGSGGERRETTDRQKRADVEVMEPYRKGETKVVRATDAH